MGKIFCPEQNREIMFSEEKLKELGREGYLGKKHIKCLEPETVKIKCRASPNCPVAKMQR